MPFSKFNADAEKYKTKTIIFETLLKLIKEFNYENITVRMICEQANISIGMFYRNFNSKDELLSFYYAKVAEGFNQIEKSAVNESDLEGTLVAYYVWSCENTVKLGVDIVSNFFTYKNRAMVNELFQKYLFRETVYCLEKAVSKGKVISEGRTPIDVANDLITISTGAIYDWCLHDGNYDLVDYMRQLLIRYLKGIM